MRFLSAFNKLAGRWMPLIVLGCLAVGIGFSGPLGLLRPAVPFAFAFMTFTGALHSNIRQLADVSKRPAALLVTLLILHLAIPLLALGVGRFFFSSSPDFVTGIVMEYVVPSAVVSVMWCSMAGGNMPLTLGILLVDTLAAPFVLPLSLRLFVGSAVRFDTFGIMRDMIWMVAVPAVLTMALNQATRDRAGRKLAPVMAPFGKIALIFIITVNSTQVAPFVLHMTPTQFGIAGVIFGLAVAGYCLGWLAAVLLRRDGKTAVSMTFGCGMRNISAGAVIASAYFPAGVIFPVMMGTLFQQAIASVFSRLLEARYAKPQ